MPRAHRRLAQAAVLWCCACSGASLEPPPTDLRGLARSPAALRAIQDLDVTVDQRVDENDAVVFERLAAEATRWAGPEAAPSLARGLYEGAAVGAPPVFALVPTGVVPKEFPSSRLRELAIEARWAAKHARLLAATRVPWSAAPLGGALARRLVGYDAHAMEPLAVCTALERLDLQLGDDNHPTAVFDLDGTVWEGNVTDGLLAVLAEHALPKETANAPLQEFLKSVLDDAGDARVARNSVAQNAQLLLDLSTGPVAERRVSLRDAFYNIVGLLQGLTEAEVAKAARLTFEKGTRRYGPWVQRFFVDQDGCGPRRLIEILRGRGVEVYLLSATPEPLVKVAAELLGVLPEHALGSLLEVTGGAFTGVVKQNTYAIKGAVVRQWLSSPPLVVFGDSPTSDFGMLVEALAAGFMVNAKPEFAERDAREAGSRLVTLTFDQLASGGPAPSAQGALGANAD